MDHREDYNCHVGGFPKPKQAIWEAPEALRLPHIVAVWIRGMWVFLGRDWKCADVGVSSGETQDERYVGVSPGERIVAWKMGIPRARRVVNEYMLDYYYCIRSESVPILRRHSPCMER